MAKTDSTPPALGESQFIPDVFPRELAEITRRRAAHGLAEPAAVTRPSTSLGLVGLAISGGGWLAAALLDIEPRLRRLVGYRHLPTLQAAIMKDLKLAGQVERSKRAA